MSEDPLRKQLYLGYHTVKRMQPRQLAGIGRRKIHESVVPRVPVDFERRYERRVPDDPSAMTQPIAQNSENLRDTLDQATKNRYQQKATQAAKGAPTFMNQTVTVTNGSGISWDDDRFEELPHLWSLKLYAFQPLFWLCRGVDPGDDALQHRFDGWIKDWIESREIGTEQYLRREYTPWAVSLRIMNWSRYLAWREDSDSGEQFDRLFRRELYKNALFLDNHIEWDVGGNHLIENGAAMVIAGCLFDNKAWKKSGERILRRTAHTQFLDDGCHFERSPMYHLLSVMRYLTVCDLLDRSGHNVPTSLRQTAVAGTTFLQSLRPPDGEIPLLNDAVYGQGVRLDDCLRYAKTLGFEPRQDDYMGTSSDANPAAANSSGYQWLKNDVGELLIDGGPVGPPHLPGHSHSDTLSVLLWIDNQPVVSDTGTAGYVSGFDRGYARGVRGHSTVQVGDTEPTAIGGKYLMGPRPEPETRFEGGDIPLFEGVYTAQPYGADGYRHHRAAYCGDRWWLLWDTVNDHDGRSVRSRLQLHPDVTPTVQEGGGVEIELSEEDSVFVHPVGSEAVSLGKGPYFPRFGESVQRSVLELTKQGESASPIESGFLITRTDHNEVAVSQQAESLQLGTNTISLPPTHL